MITNGNIDSNMAIEYNILLSDITVLIDRDEKLTQHAIQLSEYATQLTKENNSLELTINELTTQNNELLAREQALTFQIEQLRRMIYGSRRERFESLEHHSQLTLQFDVDALILEAVIEIEKISYERKKINKQHTGRHALPAHLPVVETIIEPTEDVTGMACIGREVTDELEYSPAKLYIKRTIRPKYITSPDADQKQRQIIAELDRSMPKCIAGPNLLSHILIDKYIYHLPIYRQLLRFKQEGVDIKSSTMESWLHLVAEHLKPLYSVHKLCVMNTDYIQVDESLIKVLDRDKPGATHQGYMWVYRAPLQNAVFFVYNKGRSQTAPLQYLSNFKGYLQTDGYSVYDQFGKLPDVTHLSCWAHARRYFDKALPNDKARASHILQLIQQLYAVEAQIRELNLLPPQIHKLRLDNALPIINSIGQYITQNRNAVLPKSLIGKAFEYCSNRWDNLLNYLKDGRLEIDSNQIENTIRPLALGRKNYLFAGAHHAAENIAMYYSFFATCKKHDINPQKWVAYVIRNINETKPSQLKNLLPQYIDKSLIG